MSLDIDVQGRETDYRVGIRLAGSLDTATSPTLEAALEPFLQSEDVHVLTFDLVDLEFLSSAGIRVFISSRKRLRERHDDAAVIFSQLQPQISKVFEIVRALDGVNVFSDTAELDKYLAQMQADFREQ